MARRARIPKRLAGWTLALASLLVVVWFWAGPRAVEAYVASTLRAYGVRGGRVHVRLGVGELLTGRVRKVVLEDATIDLETGLPQRLGSPETRGAPETGSPDAGPLPELPAATIEARRIRLLLPASSPIRELECGAALDTEGASDWRARLTARGQGQVLAASAHLRRAGRQADGPLSVRFGIESSPLELAGTARIERSGTERALAVELHGAPRDFAAGAGAHGIAGHGAAVTVSAHVAPAPATGFAADWRFSVTTEEAGWVELVGEAWPRWLRDLSLAGTVGARGELASAAPERAATEVEVDASLRSGAGFGIEGVAGAVRLAGIRPPTVPAGQAVRWQSIRLGEVASGAGSLRFHATAEPRVAVEGATCSVRGGGSVAVGALEIAPGSTEVATTLTLDTVALDGVLALFSRGRVHGEGSISGTLAVTVGLAPPEVRLGAGHLRATGGVLRFLDDPTTRELLERHVADPAAAGAGEYGDVVKHRIVESLKDFAFRELTFELVPGEDRLDLRAHVAGKGRTVPQELDLDVNLNGFDEIVDLALGAKLGVDRAKQRAESRAATTTSPGTNTDERR